MTSLCFKIPIKIKSSSDDQIEKQNTKYKYEMLEMYGTSR